MRACTPTLLQPTFLSVLMPSQRVCTALCLLMVGQVHMNNLTCPEGGPGGPLWRTRAVEMTTSIPNYSLQNLTPYKTSTCLCAFFKVKLYHTEEISNCSLMKQNQLYFEMNKHSFQDNEHSCYCRYSYCH